MKKNFTKLFEAIFLCALLYVVILFGGFFGVKYGLTDSSGKVDVNSKQFEVETKKMQEVSETVAQITPKAEGMVLGDEDLDKEIERLETLKKIRKENYCKIDAIGKKYPTNAKIIIENCEKNGLELLAAKMILAVKLKLENQPDFLVEYVGCEEKKINPEVSLNKLKTKYEKLAGGNVFPWINTEEWEAIKLATKKDQAMIEGVAQRVGIESRLIVSSMIVEQLRLFNSQREIFKKFFGPLKILGNATKFSWGVMGIKEATAIAIENNLKDQKSDYYLGKEYENLLDFKTADAANERYLRLTNEKDHYYSYLYGALYLKQFITQWEKAGFSIGSRPEIIGTLFNVGFPQSKPKINPEVGGSEISVGEGKYSFGSLAYEFYYSGEMIENFPYKVK